MHSALRQRSPHWQSVTLHRFQNEFSRLLITEIYPAQYLCYLTQARSDCFMLYLSQQSCSSPIFVMKSFTGFAITVAYMSDGCKLEVNSNAIFKKNVVQVFSSNYGIYGSRYRERDYGISGLISGLALLLGLSICRTLLLSAPPQIYHFSIC